MNRQNQFWSVAARLGLASGLAVVALATVRAQEQRSDQAAALAGKAAYGRSCASCHGGTLEDGEFGPPLVGPNFQSHWGARSRAELLEFITTKMPPVGAGSLGGQTYQAVTDYILQANGRPTGSAGNSAPPARGAQRSAEPAFRFPVMHDAQYDTAIAKRQAKLGSLTPVTQQQLHAPPAKDWLLWRRTYDAAGFSPLSNITRANVGALRTAWNWSLPVSQNEITPLVHDGVLFIESGATVQALDAASGDLLWQYIRSVPDELENGRKSRIKSLALFGDRLYVPTVDGHLIALDVKTGKLAWDHEIVTAEQASREGRAEGVALMLDGGPIIADGKVVIGVSLGMNNARGGCFIIALDANTGQEVWRFNTIARPGEPGGDSWNGHPVDERFGAGVWTAGSYDPDLHLAYFGIGNTYDTATLLVPNPRSRPENDGLYTDSTVALDVRTGKLVWYYQHVNRDVWDLDWVFEQSLVDIPFKGRQVKAVVTGGKIAMFDALDRATGKFLFSFDVGLQNLVTAVDPITGKKTINPAVEPEAGKAKLLCPNTLGARNWPATSFNPASKLLYIPLSETCTEFTFTPRSAAETANGGSDSRFAPARKPDGDGNFGRVQAVDLATGKTIWTRRQRAPIASAMLSTAGGVVFSGSRDRFFRALDDRDGRVLWETRLNASPSSYPITYSVNGEQFVAVVAGGGGPLDASGGGLAGEIDNPAEGTTLSVFKLAK